MKKLVIFDLDGTLLNTLDDLAAAGNHLLRAHGWPEHPAERYKLFVGNGVYKLVERMIPADADHSPGALALLRDEYNAYYSAHNADLTAPYPGVPELLGALEQAGAACAVLSNKPHAFTVELCRSLLGERFAVVHGQREGWPTKPDRLLTAEILEETGIRAADTVYVGDSGVDMQTAKNGGLFAVGSLWGFRSEEELRENGADAVAERPLDLLRYIR